MNLHMSVTELQRRYSEGSNKREMLSILADLNSCSVPFIKQQLGLLENDPVKKQKDPNLRFVAELSKAGKSDSEIARMFSVPESYVKHKRSRLKPRRSRDKRLERYRSGWTIKEIAEAEGVSVDSVYSWLRRRGVRIHSKNHLQRLKLYRQGKSDSEIAEATGFARNTIAGWRTKHGLKVNRASKSYRRDT